MIPPGPTGGHVLNGLSGFQPCAGAVRFLGTGPAGPRGRADSSEEITSPGPVKCSRRSPQALAPDSCPQQQGDDGYNFRKDAPSPDRSPTWRTILPDGGGGLGVVWRGGIPGGNSTVQDTSGRAGGRPPCPPALPGSLSSRTRRFIPDYRHRQRFRQHFPQNVGIVGRDQVDVLGALGDEIQAGSQSARRSAGSQTGLWLMASFWQNTHRRGQPLKKIAPLPWVPEGRLLPSGGRPERHWRGRHPAKALTLRLGAQGALHCGDRGCKS